MVDPDLDAVAFERMFRADVKVLVDWDRLRSPEWLVSSARLGTRAALGRVFTPWYVDRSGAEVSYDHADGRPLTVAAAATAQGLHTWREERLAEMESTYRDGILAATLPCVKVGDRLLMLDGNHRATAAYRARAQIDLTLVCLAGPVDQALLPDLKHHPRKQSARAELAG